MVTGCVVDLYTTGKDWQAIRSTTQQETKKNRLHTLWLAGLEVRMRVRRLLVAGQRDFHQPVTHSSDHAGHVRRALVQRRAQVALEQVRNEVSVNHKVETVQLETVATVLGMRLCSPQCHNYSAAHTIDQCLESRVSLQGPYVSL